MKDINNIEDSKNKTKRNMIESLGVVGRYFYLLSKGEGKPEPHKIKLYPETQGKFKFFYPATSYSMLACKMVSPLLAPIAFAIVTIGFLLGAVVSLLPAAYYACQPAKAKRHIEADVRTAPFDFLVFASLSLTSAVLSFFVNAFEFFATIVPSISKIHGKQKAKEDQDQVSVETPRSPA